jgi:hypothetical protein
MNTCQKIYRLSLLFLLFPYTAIGAIDCPESRKNLSYLEKNFNKLYRENYSEFWVILHSSFEEAKSCRSIEKTSKFLGLANVQTGNAEFEQFFSESIENLCLSSPKCFNEASQRLPKAVQERLKEKLNGPLFIDKERLYKSGCLNDNATASPTSPTQTPDKKE